MVQQTQKQATKLEEILSQYDTSIKHYDKYRSDWGQYYKRYRSILDSSTSKDYYAWRNELFIPATASGVDGLVFNLALTLFGSTPFYDVAPREANDVSRALLAKELISYCFDKSKFKMEFSGNFIKQLSIYGTSFGKVVQRDITRTTKKKKPINEPDLFGNEVPTGETEVETEDEVVYSGPVFETIDIFDLIVSPDARSLSDTWVIHRTVKTLGELKALMKKGIYKNVGDLEMLIENKNSADTQYDRGRKESTGLPSAWGDEPGDLRTIELLEYWDKRRENVTTIAGRLKVIRDTENPLGIDPFVSASLWALPFEIYGIGIPEKCLDLQDQLNAEVNQRLDNRNLRQNLILKVQRGNNVNYNSLDTRPGAVWLMDDINAVQEVNVPDTSSASSFTEESLLKQEIEEVTGITKYSKGSGVGGDRTTATEASLVARAGSKGFAYMVMLIEESALKPIIEKYYQLIETFMEDEQVIRVAGEKGMEFVNVRPQDIKGSYDFIPQGTTELVDKNLKVQYLIQMLSIAKDDQTLNRQAVYKKIWEALGQKDFTDLFTGAPQMPMSLDAKGGGMNPTNAGRQTASPASGVRAGSPQEGAIPIGMGGV